LKGFLVAFKAIAAQGRGPGADIPPSLTHREEFA